MELITKLFDMDLSALVPEMSTFLAFARVVLVLALLAGPVTFVAMGALYLFRPTPEANYKFGFRTYYGMGSVEAWNFSQRIAGMIFGGLGALLFLGMLVVVLCFGGKDLSVIARTSAICLIIQATLALLARLAAFILPAVYFDKEGNHRK